MLNFLLHLCLRIKAFLIDRGSLTQLVREGYRQVNVIKSKAGVCELENLGNLNENWQSFHKCIPFFDGKCSERIKEDIVKSLEVENAEGVTGREI